ncbi:hypothetical protein Taro_023902, partial [Colocasia esculenta]|nr:hypothetical protein [Colocasia esculenta]
MYRIEIYRLLVFRKTSKGSILLLKLSLGSPKKPPKHHSSWFLVDLFRRLGSGKPSSMLQLAPGCCRWPDEAPIRQIKACKVRFFSQKHFNGNIVGRQAKISTAMAFAVKFRSVQNTDPISQHKEKGGIQDTRKNPEKCWDLGHMYRIEIYRLLAFLKTSKGSILLLKLSLGSPKKSPKHHSSWFLVDLFRRLGSGKPSSMLQLAPGCCRWPDEAPICRIKACKVRFFSQK